MDNRRKIRVHFADFWPDFQPEDFFIYQLLSRKYRLEQNEATPDYLFFSSFGDSHLRYKDCVKIYWTGENLFPDFNLCDYAMGCAFLQFGDRYLRFPEWVIYNRASMYNKAPVNETMSLNRKFCNFVYSNSENADPFRLRFFKRLSEYKRIDSGGQLENNIGGCVVDKLFFLSKYKFTIAFENSRVDGYTTEKLIEPLSVDSLPIYWGNPCVHLDFNIDAMVYVRDCEAMDEAIEEIIALDNDDAAYLEKLRQPCFPNGSYKDWWKKPVDFLDHILNQDKEEAIRRAAYGAQLWYCYKKSTLGLHMNHTG